MPKKRWILIFALLMLTAAADQWSKHWARDNLRGKPASTVVKNYFKFEYHENPGMAFGLGRKLPGSRYLFIGVGVVVLVLVWRVVRAVGKGQRWADAAFGLVAGGAIGNVIDRIAIGRVVDFIVLHWRHRYEWPAFNIADAALCVGVGILLLVLGRQPNPKKG